MELFCLYLFLLVLSLLVHEKRKHFLVWEHLVSAYGSDTGLNSKFLAIFLFLFVHISFKSYCS